MENINESITGKEKHQLLVEFNATAVPFPAEQTLIGRFEEQVEKNPDGIAVVFKETELSFGTINIAANQLAAYLKRNYTINVNDLVAIKLERSEWMIIAILAVLKSGAAYVPIDPDYPQERVDYITDDSKAVLIIDDTELSKFNAVKDNYAVENSPLTASSTDLAYVIYTSGSTGKPKGCMLAHRGLINRLNWMWHHYNYAQKDIVLQKTTFTFDVSIPEIFLPLCWGLKMVVSSKEAIRSPHVMLDLVAKEQVTSMHFVPSMLNAFLATITGDNTLVAKLQSLRIVFTSGEALSVQTVKQWYSLLDIPVHNLYGPTEASVEVTYYPTSKDDLSIPIGKPIWNTSIYILDEFNQLVPAGLTGEICIGGTGLALGYLNQPELTQQKFVPNPFIAQEKIYKTGDLGRWLPDGNIAYQGRKDDQVKIRGYRIELGEIEAALLAITGITAAVVIAKPDVAADKKLIAYLVTDQPNKNITLIQKQLIASLPEYMLPSTFVWLDEIPTLANGKTDKKSLPEPDRKRPELSVLFKAAKTADEKKLAIIWARTLDLEKVGIQDNFFELGGNSLLALKTLAEFRLQHHTDIPITKLYQFPTIEKLSNYLGTSTKTQAKKPLRSISAANASASIAIIGMAGKFPGAATIDELWDVLYKGKETTSFFSKEDLHPSIPAAERNDPDYVAARGILRDAEFFDADFFGINPKLAELMDPQQRLFLQISRDVLEQSGHLPEKYDGIIGVYAGCGYNTYYQNNVAPNKTLIDNVGSFQVATVNEKDYISSRTAYQLDLKGPAVSVFSACSTSLLAISQAVESLRKNQCDVAIAGGASVTSPIISGHLYQEGAMLSKDGHCRSFDANATGTVFSDGAGVVLLKTLTNAEADGDTIYGIIKGTGVNNDGAGKGSFTAPSTDGQAAAISMAIQDAAIDASTITYVETHGTATPLGDPIEIEGLKQAFGEQAEKQYCAIGSIKSNMGHLTAAAGVAGLIKTTLALYHKIIPPSINFEKPNPNIDFKNSPFYVNHELSSWTSDTVRRAGVSSFGVGGTNVHVVLEEYNGSAKTKSDQGRKKQLFTWSAQSLSSLTNYNQNLQAYLQANEEINLADAASTLQYTRANLNFRSFAIAANTQELQAALAPQAAKTPLTAELKELPEEVVFLFPGQGAQYLNMGLELYEHEQVFKDAIAECAVLLMDYLDKDIRTVIYPDQLNADTEKEINNTTYTQPALFVIEYALAKLWMSWGIEPTILCGHSIGEYVAAHFAGVFSLAQGLKLIASRAALVGKLPGGSMLSVRAAASAMEGILPAGLSVAAINSPKLCVIAGNDQAIDNFQELLDSKNILHKKLPTSHAFHSSMMDPILKEFKQVVEEVQLNRPQKPVVSTVTGQFLSDQQAQDPNYWTEHLRNTVQFSAALDVILELENPVLIEVGPGNSCTTLAFQHGAKNKFTAIASLDKKEALGAYTAILTALGKSWSAGLNPDWNAFYASQDRARINMPTYAYTKKLCWVEPVIPSFIPTTITPQYPTAMRKDTLIEKIKHLLENASGIEMEGVTSDLSFIEIGLDSLLLTQVALTLKKEFALPITFRQLNEEYATIDALAAYIDSNLPEEKQAQHTDQPAAVTPAYYAAPNTYPATGYPAPVDSSLGLIAQQLQLLSKQVELLTGTAAPLYQQPQVVAAHPEVQKTVLDGAANPTKLNLSLTELSAEEQLEIKKPFGASPRIEKKAATLTLKQEGYLAALTKKYNDKTAGSKNQTQSNRSHMADPRVVSGFKPATKELVYSIIINKSKGSRIWDVDGNEYIDALNGFGSNLLGYQPDVIKNALLAQIEKGYEIGPQHELAGEVTKLICEFTDFERSALCNTGSEAVLGAMRIARTVTGRSLIVAFSGSYHGIVDEVIVRGTKKLKTFPGAPGIMPEAVQNMLILDYGTDETLAIIRSRANELAAVLVEPVQSRRPDFQPIEFLKQLREITQDSNTALIFDEVISGFRFHPRGVQGIFGIKADLATYGKVVGGGISIGIIAGKREFMDALDGGMWQYGDDSIPEIGVTYFAGTFVRHPLALATTKASLLYMKEQGPQLQIKLTDNTAYLANSLNQLFSRLNVPLTIAQFGSLWRVKFEQEYLFSELLFTLLRFKGIHILDGFPCFLTTAHSQADIDQIIQKFEESLQELIAADFIPAYTHRIEEEELPVAQNSFATPPLPGAKLGKDENGNPAWFIQDEKNPGKYLQVN